MTRQAGRIRDDSGATRMKPTAAPSARSVVVRGRGVTVLRDHEVIGRWIGAGQAALAAPFPGTRNRQQSRRLRSVGWLSA